MSLRSLFAEIFGPAWNDVRAVPYEASTLEQAFAHAFGHEAAAAIHTETAIVHHAEEDTTMLSQEISSLFDQIGAAFTRAANKISSLESELAAKIAENTSLAAELADIKAAVSSAASAAASLVVDPAPAPAPAADASEPTTTAQ